MEGDFSGQGQERPRIISTEPTNGGINGGAFGGVENGGNMGSGEGRDLKKKALMIGGAVALVLLVAAGVALIVLNNKKAETERTAVVEKTEEGTWEFSLAEYGIPDDLSAEETNKRLEELGLYDPNETYENSEDIDEATYCADGECDGRTVEREDVEWFDDEEGWTEEELEFQEL